MSIKWDMNEKVKIEHKPEEEFNITATDEIIVDSHEPVKIINLLKKNMVKHRIDTLPIGDFIRGNVCVERKSMSDFITSYQGKHIQKQLMQMEENFDMSFLIISGKHSEVAFNPRLKGWTVNHHMGALSSIAVRYPRIKVLQVDNDNQLVNLMIRIMEKAHDGKVPTLYDTELMKNKMTTDDIRVKMLGCIPKVGLKKAQELAEIIGIKLYDKKTQLDITPEHLKDVKGVGKVLSEKIVGINKD